MKNILLIALSMLAVNGCGDKAKELPYENIETTFFGDGFEPSGIAYCNDTLYVVSDEGSFYTYRNGKGTYFTIKEEADYEGVTCKGGRVWLAEEGKDNIVEVSQDGKILNKFNIERNFEGEQVISKKGDGLEGLTFFKEDADSIHFITSNQSDEFKGNDKSAIFYVKADKKTKEAKITRYFPMKINDIAGLFYKDGVVYFVSDDRDTLYIADEDINILKSFKLPGKAQEGVAIDAQSNTMYIADDKGSVLKLKLTEQLLD